MAKYMKREMADLNGSGKTQAHYRVMSYGRRTFEEFVEACAQGSTVTPADIVAVISRVSAELAWQLSSGYSVTIDGLGTFSGKLGVVSDKALDDFEQDTEHRNARSLAFTGVNYKVDKRLVYDINKKCHKLERGGESRLKHSPYTKEERIERARQWLREHLLMHVADYAVLNKLSRTTASLELRDVANDPESGIISQGRRTAKVYLLASR